MPPKLRTQGRFQGITRLGQWAEKILKALAGSGCAQDDSLRAKLRSAMTGLAFLRPFIERFALTAHRMAEVLAILKNQGLHPDTYRQCCQLAEQLPPRCKVKKRLLNWLQRQLHIQRQLGIQPLLVSSDIIESLFGKFKHVTARGTQAEMNRTVLVLPKSLSPSWAFSDSSLTNLTNSSFTLAVVSVATSTCSSFSNHSWLPR